MHGSIFRQNARAFAFVFCRKRFAFRSTISRFLWTSYLIITGATHPSLRRTVGLPGAIASLFSEAARPRDPPFRFPTATPRSFVSRLSWFPHMISDLNFYYFFQVFKHKNYSRIIAFQVKLNTHPVGFASSSCRNGLLSARGDGELGRSRSPEKSAFKRSPLRDCPRALRAHDRSSVKNNNYFKLISSNSIVYQLAH